MTSHYSALVYWKNFRMEKGLISSINETFSLELSASSYHNIKLILSEKINDWINNDFNKLIHVLYRIDVSEKKINELLKENRTEDAADILADLVIERELQKIEARKISGPSSNENDEETW